MSIKLPLTVLLTLAVALPPAADAQFSKLKKAVTEKAATAAGVPATPPRFVTKINLTSAQLAQVNRGLDAEIAATPRVLKEAEDALRNQEAAQKQFERDLEAYEKKRAKREDCRTRLIASEQAQEDALKKKAESAAGKVNIEESEKTDLQAEALRVKEAAQRISAGTGTAADRKLLADFQARMSGIQGRVTEALTPNMELSAFKQAQEARMGKSCGDEPQKPADPSAPARKAASEKISDEGSKAAGVPKPLWFAWRDELLGLAMSNTRVQPGGDLPPSEADAINQQIDAARAKITEMKKVGVPF